MEAAPYFRGKWIKNSDTLAPYLKFNKTMKLPVDVSKIAGGEANGIDPDQMPYSMASDLGLHCLLRHDCPNI